MVSRCLLVAAASIGSQLALLGASSQILVATFIPTDQESAMRVMLVALILTLSISIAAAQGTPTAAAEAFIDSIPEQIIVVANQICDGAGCSARTKQGPTLPK